MWMAPLLLALLGLLFGCLPFLVDGALLNPAARAMFHAPIGTSLKIWHGFNGVLLLSGITLVSGAVLYALRKPSLQSLASIERFNTLSPRHVFGKLADYAKVLSRRYTHTLHNGFLRVYLLRIIVFAILLLAFRLFTGGPVRLTLDNISPVSAYEIVVAAILVAAIFLAVTTPSRLTAVVATSVIGYCICLQFVFYSAPDLAMTQFSIDTLTVVLFVLVLFRLPPFLNFANRSARIRDWTVALAFGAVISLIAIQVLNQPFDEEVSLFYGDNAYTLAKGKNVVNVILVDFRGFDTMFEIVVLSIAAIGVFSLLKLRLNASEKE